MKPAGVIRRLLYIAIALAVVSVAAVGVLSWQMGRLSAESQARAVKSAAQVENLLALINRGVRVQATMQKMARERDPDKLEGLLAELETQSKECREAVNRTAVPGGVLDALFASGDKVKENVIRGDYAPAQQAMLEEAAPAFDALLGAITAAETAEEKRSQAEAGAQLAAGRMVERTLSGGAVILVLLLSATTLWVLRRVHQDLKASVGEISESAEQMATASGQVSSSSEDLARDASNEAASLQQTTAASHELRGLTQKNSENARKVTGLMTGTSEVVAEANRKLGEMVQSMQSIAVSSGKVSKIIKVIDEIAFQTNILALNAAVEAARAGNMGQGFAVVADEVRNLAQRCAQAASDTTNLIQESIAKSKEGGRKLDEVASVIEQITRQADEARALSEEVNAGSEQQAQGINQLSTTLNQMEDLTIHTASSAERSAAAARQTAAQCTSMRVIVERLQLLVGAD
jgi:methyl-accepting chemotaxis protein